VPFCPPQIPHDLTCDRTWSAAVGSQVREQKGQDSLCLILSLDMRRGRVRKHRTERHQIFPELNLFFILPHKQFWHVLLLPGIWTAVFISWAVSAILRILVGGHFIFLLTSRIFINFVRNITQNGKLFIDDEAARSIRFILWGTMLGLALRKNMRCTCNCGRYRIQNLDLMEPHQHARQKFLLCSQTCRMEQDKIFQLICNRSMNVLCHGTVMRSQVSV
jgi:hypothetical protein